MLRWAPLLLLGIALLVLFNVRTLHDGGGATAAASTASVATASLSLATKVPLPTAPSRTAPPPAGSCVAANATELAGVVVRWGDGHTHSSWQECCAACEAHSGGVPAPGAPACNVWVYCPHHVGACGARAGQCWLKRQALFEGVAAGVMAAGAGVPWVSGALPRYDPPPDADALGVEMRTLVPAEARAWPPPRRRECGSPAVDGYSHVDPSCLERSATAAQFDAAEAARLALVVWAEQGASYDGLAVAWGIGNKKPTAAACADACRRHVPDPPNGPARLGGQFGKLPCNAFVWCPAGRARCFEPDAHTHTGGDCWLKFTEVPEQPEVNARGVMDDPATHRDGRAYHARHAGAEATVPWVSGVLLPPGATPGNGTWGPRALW